jgi:hypothetical protein
MYLRGAFAICAGLAASCSVASAQNINDVMRLFGGVMQNAIVQAAYSEWRKLPENELACIDQFLRQRGTSLEAAIRQGINPQDTRISSARAACRSASAATNLPSPTFDCSKVSYADERAICSNAELAQLDHAVVAAYELVRQKFGDQYAKNINAPLFQARRACGANVSCIKERQLAAIQKFQGLGAFGPSAEPAQRQELLWDHNGSTVYLVAQGRSRKFFYRQPRKGLLAAGVKPDSMIFSGEVAGEHYRGTAYIFNNRCGRLPYAVSGPILDNYRRVELRGRAPKVDNNCRTVAYADDVLVFQLIEPLPMEDLKVAGTAPSTPTTTDAQKTKEPEAPQPSNEIVLADIRSIEKVIENRLGELQNKESRQKVADIAARLATANIDTDASELGKLRAEGKLVTEIFKDADEFKRVSHVADERLAAVKLSLENITSDAPIIQQLKSTMDEVKTAQKEFGLRQLQVALKKLNDLYDRNRQLLKSMEFGSP